MVVPNNPWPGYVTSRTGGQVAWWKETRNTNRESHGGRWGSQPERQQISTIHTWSYKKRGFNPNPVRRKKTGCVCLCSTVSILNESGSLCALLVLWTQTEKIRESSEGAGRRSAPGPTPERCAPDWNAAQCRNLEKWVIHLLPVRVLRALPAGHKTLLRKKSHRQQVVPSSAAAAEAGTLLKAEAHDDDWRPEFERSCSEPRACLKSLLAVDRSTCPPGAHPTPSPPSFPSCSSSPPLSKRTSHLSTPASTTHLADILSHDGDCAPWGLKHEGEN